MGQLLLSLSKHRGQTVKALAERMIKEALWTVDPHHLILNRLYKDGDNLVIRDELTLHLSDYRHIYLIGIGKGVAPMAAAMEEILGERLYKSRIIVKYDHGQPLNKTEVYEAGHPIPDANTLKGSQKLLELAREARADDLVFVLITGGGSALFELLPQSMGLEDLAHINSMLIASGASIDEINTVRKHLSLVKGGRLAGHISPARCVSLILSDVIGDPLESIASGPTAPDPTMFADARNILEKYNLWNKLSPQIRLIIEGKNEKVGESPGKNDPVFRKVNNIIIGNNRLALETLRTVAQDDGYKTLILTDRAEGEAREIGVFLAGLIRSAKKSGIPFSSPGCLIFGGEPTVTIKGKGKGGRNQELALAVLLALRNFDEPYYFCSVGSDGTDGPTDAAGAWIDEKTWQKVIDKNMDARIYLENNDAYHFFQAINQLIITGPTRTNVMDLIFFLV